MNLRRMLLLQVLIAGLLAMLAHPAAAAPPRQLDGSFHVIQFIPGTERLVGNGNILLSEYQNRGLIAGDLTSTEPQQEQGRCVVLIHRGTLRCHGTVIFTGTIAGIDGEGTSTSRFHLTCDTETGDCAGRTVVVAGTGALSGVHGHTTFTSSLFTGAGVYTSFLTAPWDD